MPITYDYFSSALSAITDMLNQQATFFLSEGLAFFQAIATILVSWFGIQSALASAEGVGGFRWGRFSNLLVEIVFVYMMLAFYATPIPGIGVSFTHLILDEATYLVGRLNQSSIQEIMETLNVIETTIPYPSPYEIMAMFRFFLMFIAIIAAQMVTVAIILFGYVATAVLVLLGPLFIPFKLVPQMDWMFWSWFRAFIQYAFYQVVASAYVYVWGNFLLRLLGAKETSMSGGEFAVNFVPMLVVLGVFVLGMVKIPSLVFSLFSGRSGDSVLWKWKD